jgi:long-chain acyl-CoA synthetase
MVTDRKKEIFKLSNGKFIAPQLIENVFKESPLIDQIMVVGEHEKFASALISPNFKHFDELRTSKKISFSESKPMVEGPEVISFFTSEIETINKSLNPHERILRFRLVPDEWTPATGELSPTLKLRRQVITEKYRDLLDQVYRK